MMDLVHFWREGTKLAVTFHDSPCDFVKIASFSEFVFLLDVNKVLWRGVVHEGVSLELEKTQLTGVDIGNSSNHLFLVTDLGKVIKCSPSLENIDEIILHEEASNCVHGYATSSHRVFVKSIAVGSMGILFISDTGELWASGDHPQLGIRSKDECPRKVNFFDCRHITAVACGEDFNVVLCHKKEEVCPVANIENGESEVFLSACPQCVNENVLSPLTPQSSSDVCPLGVKFKKSSESLSASTSTSKNNNCAHKNNSNSSSCSEDSNHLSDMTECAIPAEVEGVYEQNRTGSSMLLINTEAARQFLTRQLSWVSSGGEELLAEVTGPTRIIRRNVSSVASLVYERVKTVSDKVATLSRHVSGGSNNSESFEEFEELNKSNASLNSSFRLEWSCSDNSEEPVVERDGKCISKGSRLIRGEVWAWGNAIRGQLGTGDTVQRHKPVLVGSVCHIGAVGVWCGLFHCLIQTLDGRIIGWGCNENGQLTHDNEIVTQSSPLFISKALFAAAGNKHSVLLTSNGSLLWLASSKKSVPSLEFLSSTPENFSPLRLLVSGDITCFILTEEARAKRDSDLAHEQCFLEELLNVYNTIVKPLSRKSSLEETVSNLCSRYNDVIYMSAVIVMGLLDGKSSCDVLAVNEDDVIFVYESYLSTVCDVLAMNGFAQITKTVELPLKISASFYDRLPTRKTSPESIITCAFSQPMSRIAVYKSMVSRGGGNFSRLEKLASEQDTKRKEAEITKAFWESAGGRLPDCLRAPHRRVIRDSRASPLNLHNASRFSSHWFILMSDCFVHFSGGSYTCYSLDVVWVDNSHDSEQFPNTFSVITPEDTMVLVTANHSEKNEWLHSFQSAIASYLNKSTAPTARTATHLFTKKPGWKDVKYAGRWLVGKFEGYGKIEWPNGRVYTGQFHNNVAHGFGRLEAPNTVIYEGQWRDGVLNGHANAKFENGDLYVGYFKDNNESGHGVKKTGMLSSGEASVYIGEWLLGQKHGYGVLNKLCSGEKYLGLWSEDVKNGLGISVTLDGIYYEGTFQQDVLTGKGVMVFEDGTHYEGELKEAGVFFGRGILTFSSGDTFEGNLNGSWTEGIKINGILHKNMESTSPRRSFSKPKSFGQLCVPADQKWKSIFRQCWSSLGVNGEPNGTSAETTKAWENIAAILGSRHGGRNLDLLQKIPNFSKTELDLESYDQIANYLQQAFDTIHHPLGRAFQELVEAYTASYGGVLLHHLLLPQAVAELSSITLRLYQIVNFLFPTLPDHTTETFFNDENKTVASMCGLLHPIILPKLYSSLLILYSLHNRAENDTYWKRLLKWNRQPDVALMAFLAVDKKFWQKNDGTPISENIFSDAVESLQQLKTTFSPMEKLVVIQNTFKEITKTVQGLLGEKFIWQMDDLFPVFHYVVVRSHIQELGSEIQFIEDFMEERLKHGEMDIMLTTLKACYFQILQEKIIAN